jgi:hypothetical protein
MPPELVHPPGQLAELALQVAEHALLRDATPTDAAAIASDSHATQSPRRV